MKKNLVITIIVVLLIALSAAITYIIKSEHDKSEAVFAAHKNEIHSCCGEEKEKSEASENSIYQLDSKWKTETGKEISLSELSGKPQIMAMIFTSCTYACPIIVNDIKKIEAGIPKEKLGKVNFLLVSIDPERDTPETLMQFAKKQKLNPNRWKLLTADENSVSELAAVMGFKYKKEKDGSFSHSNIISVLDKNGEIAFQHFELNEDITDVIEAFNKLN
ncbi:MAG: SCO family protein [Bacteroidota bacterium]